jgi:hypothetical protein
MRGKVFVSSQFTTRLATKQLNIDGLRYNITVRKVSEEMYRASWSCTQCKEEGAWAPLSADPKQAVEMARFGLEAHHTFLHHGGAVKRAE